MSDIVCIAHRGASGEGHAPENTLAAFQEAIESGADAVECDVHCTKDGQVVVLHDYTLDRTTDVKGAVDQMTLDEVRKADAGSWFGSRFSGERIPTLGEVLELAKGKAVTAIEVKPHNITGKVVKEIENIAAEDEVVLQSFHPRVVADSQGFNPQIPRALLVGGRNGVKKFPGILNLIREAAKTGAGALNLSSKLITPELVRECHRRGISAWTWTVDEEAEMRALAAMGIDAITTNYPKRLISALAAASDAS